MWCGAGGLYGVSKYWEGEESLGFGVGGGIQAKAKQGGALDIEDGQLASEPVPK